MQEVATHIALRKMELHRNLDVIDFMQISVNGICHTIWTLLARKQFTISPHASLECTHKLRAL